MRIFARTVSAVSVVGNRIPMELTSQDNGWEAEGGLEEGLDKGQPNQVMVPVDHGATNFQ